MRVSWSSHQIVEVVMDEKSLVNPLNGTDLRLVNSKS